MDIIHFGIIGPGNIANRFAQAVANVPAATVTAVASRERARAQAFADTYDIPHVFGSYEELAQSDTVDAVYIATPHPFHASCAILCMQHGKHVLCEKPLCMNESEALALFRCAKENGVFLMEAMWTRFLPAIQAAIDIVNRGDIGDVRGFQADFCYATTPAAAPRAFENVLGGGALLDVGVYGLHVAAMFLGNAPQHILALADICDGADMHTHVLMKYENGAIANITAAVDVKKPEDAYVYGTKGRVYIPCFYGTTELFVTTDHGDTHIVKPYIGNGFEEQIIDMCTCIQNGATQSALMPHDQSLVILKQMDAIRSQIGLRYPADVT